MSQLKTKLEDKLDFNIELSLSPELNYDSLLGYTRGDLVILGMKYTGKTTLLMNLARRLRANKRNHVIVFETFPKWIHEFDSVNYCSVTDDDVVEEAGEIMIKDEHKFSKILNENKDIVFLVECLDMERISTFMSFIIYTIYRKQYKRAKANQLKSVNEEYWFLTEEAHNLLDSTILAKKVFNKLRKMQNEFRNLKMHLICVALRLQDLSPKIRAKMDLILSKVSLDDYQLKVRELLRGSKYKREITKLPVGTFVYPEKDLILQTSPFKQKGKPHNLDMHNAPNT